MLRVAYETGKFWGWRAAIADAGIDYTSHNAFKPDYGIRQAARFRLQGQGHERSEFFGHNKRV